MGLSEGDLSNFLPVRAFKSPVLIVTVRGPPTGEIIEFPPHPLNFVQRSFPKILVSRFHCHVHLFLNSLRFSKNWFRPFFGAQYRYPA